jgi:hypothetical protein
MTAFPVRSAFLVTATALGVCAGSPAFAQDHDHDGFHGQGHAQWHESFYRNLLIPGTKSSCCNLSDCRPTQIRTNGDHYEIMKDGRWIKVDPSKIVKAEAPDGGAHICAPDVHDTRAITPDPDLVYCIVMPAEI